MFAKENYIRISNWLAFSNFLSLECSLVRVVWGSVSLETGKVLPQVSRTHWKRNNQFHWRMVSYWNIFPTHIHKVVLKWQYTRMSMDDWSSPMAKISSPPAVKYLKRECELDSRCDTSSVGPNTQPMPTHKRWHPMHTNALLSSYSAEVRVREGESMNNRYSNKASFCLPINGERMEQLRITGRIEFFLILWSGKQHIAARALYGSIQASWSKLQVRLMPVSMAEVDVFMNWKAFAKIFPTKYSVTMPRRETFSDG